jgi:hypothetical protein
MNEDVRREVDARMAMSAGQRAQSECRAAEAGHRAERAELARRWRAVWPEYIRGVLLGAGAAGIVWLVSRHAGETMAWFYLAWFGTAGLFALWVRARMRGWFHRHTGYVSVNGTVWGCQVCGRPPKDCEAQVAKALADEAERRAAGRLW